MAPDVCLLSRLR